MRRQAQRDTVTCLRSHSTEVKVLTLELLCFPQVAQGNLQAPFSHMHPGRGSWGAGERIGGLGPRTQSLYPHGLWRPNDCPFSGSSWPQQGPDLGLQLNTLPSPRLPVALGIILPIPWNSGFHGQPEPRAQRFAAAQMLETSQQSLMTMFTLTKE